MSINNKLFILFIIGLLLSTLIFYKHKDLEDYDWKAELFADQSGYYIYLPALFIYNFSPKELPPNIEVKSGLGFKLDNENNKIITKYTYGIALLQLPFFLIIHNLVILSHLKADGFSHLYQEIPNISMLFYTLLAFYFAYKFLLFYFDKKLAAISLALVFIGTNWYHYSIDSTGMSHGYSAFLISFLSFKSKDYAVNSKTLRLQEIFLLFLIAGVIVLIRPINIIILPFLALICLDYNAIKMFIISLLKKPYYLLFIIYYLLFGILLPLILTFIPQLLYWKYAYNSYFAYSYGEEGFIFKFNPQFAHLWFSPDNGLFLYNPLYLIIVICLIRMAIIGFREAKLIFSLFVIMSYIYCSWHAVSYGCSFGQRNYVDLSIFWCLPISYTLKYTSVNSNIKSALIKLILFIVISINIYLIYNYNKCYFSSKWDYSEYFYYYTKQWHKEINLLDCEILIDPKDEFTTAFEYSKQKSFYKMKFAEITFDVKYLTKSTEALARLELLKDGEVISIYDHKLDYFQDGQSDWETKKFIFEFPKAEHRETKYRLVFRNKSLMDKYVVKNFRSISY